MGVVLGVVYHRPAAHDVVGHDQRAAAGELERPREVLRIALIIGVDEDQVEGATALGGQLRKRLERRSDAELDDPGQTGVVDVGTGDRA